MKRNSPRFEGILYGDMTYFLKKQTHHRASGRSLASIMKLSMEKVTLMPEIPHKFIHG